MKRNLKMSLFLILGAAASGCAASAADDEGGGGSGSGSGSGSNPDPVPASPEGTFKVRSDFDLATNLPGTAGEVINYFIQATDDPDDPAKFILEKAVEALPSGPVKSTLQSTIPFVAGYVNDRLLEVAPDFVAKIVQLGDTFGQVARHFGTNERMVITASGQAVKTIQGLHFKIDSVDMDLPFSDYAIPETTVAGLSVTLDKLGKLSIGEHKVPLKYGQLLRLAIDEAIIPFVDPTASNLNELFANSVDCAGVGQYVYEAIGFGSASTYESACTAGLFASAIALYVTINSIDDNALEFSLTGVAKGLDKNNDRKMDDIVSGVWSGSLSYSGTPAPLASSKFFGSRL